MKGTAKSVVIPGMGEFRSYREACEHVGVSYGCLHSRLANGYYNPENVRERERLPLGIPSKKNHITVGTFASFQKLDYAAKFFEISLMAMRARISCNYYGDPEVARNVRATKAINTMWKPIRSVA